MMYDAIPVMSNVLHFCEIAIHVEKKNESGDHNCYYTCGRAAASQTL